METTHWALSIPEDEVLSLVVCLGIGTLYAIREGILPPKTGIWTLGRPNLWGPLDEHPGIPQSVLDVLSQCDELSAISQLLPDRLQPKINELIEQLVAALDDPDDVGWTAKWRVSQERDD
jgi:hypothetical protein